MSLRIPTLPLRVGGYAVHIEWIHAGEELEQDNSQGPRIRLLAVGSPSEDFGCSKLNVSNNSECDSVGVDHACVTESTDPWD